MARMAATTSLLSHNALKEKQRAIGSGFNADMDHPAKDWGQPYYPVMR